MAKGVSGSTIKSWFQYRCERKTRYEIMDPSELAAIPVAKDDREKPWALLGVDFEDRIIRRLAREKGVLLPPDTEGLRENVAAAFLQGKGSTVYAAQLNLKPRNRPSFLGPDLFLRRSFADLVRRDTSGPVSVFRVIDIKATRSARAFHKTQVAFYALLLEAVLEENGIAGRIDPEGEIWRIPDDGDALHVLKSGVETAWQAPQETGDQHRRYPVVQGRNKPGYLCEGLPLLMSPGRNRSIPAGETTASTQESRAETGVAGARPRLRVATARTGLPDQSVRALDHDRRFGAGFDQGRFRPN